ncbi:twin-arginine translocation signal domain-containing protein [Flavitalea sp.]|nr:twin-arginine translocation signal domain-containing protein [Flavitalea sp.]
MKHPSRRNFLKNAALTGAAAWVNPVSAFSDIDNIQGGQAKTEDLIIGHGSYRYKVDKAWAKINAGTTPLANCHEMVQDSKGNLIMLGDEPKNNVLIFDKSGKLIDTWGHGFPGGHGLSISNEGGTDYLMITDCGYFNNPKGGGNSQAGQVVKMTTDGRLVFAIGHPRTIGIYKDEEPFRPTETAVAPNGDIYVADGYGSDYIIHYNSKGQYIRHFGGHNNSNPDHNLRNAHGVTVDNRQKDKPVLICTSREENCFKVFSMDGKYLNKIDMPGMYVCRAVINGENLYAGTCWSKDANGKRKDRSGFVTILDKKNQVISNPGGKSPDYKQGLLQPVLQDESAVFAHCHDVCIDDEKNLYVCQWNANQTPPVKLTLVS